MHLRRVDALLYFPAVIIGGMITLGGLAWVYEKTRRKIEHPKWGTVVLDGDHWRFLVPHFLEAEPAVTVELPGTRKEPHGEDLERFEKVWPRVPEMVEAARPKAIEDLQDAYDAVLGEPLEAVLRPVIERVAADPKTLEQDWKLGVVRLCEGRHGGRYWSLEFETSWDEEHQRTAYYDLDGKLLRYDLSVAEVDL